MERNYNFSAGPATLPEKVLKKVQSELLDYQNSGASLMEMSHRGKVFDEVHAKSVERLRKLAAIPDDFDILYMTGGASTQFALIPMNLSGSGRNAGYVDTGSWSKKAIEQAKLQDVDVFLAASSKESNHNHIPNEIATKDGLDYLHITTNNTIFGTQFAALPDPGSTRLVVDMSSDFLSRPIDWKHAGLVYAGAQKNAGPAGLTIVVIRKDYYERESEKTPSMFRYSTFAENDSRYNTPPTFLIYIFGLVLEWIEEMGGLEKMDEHNKSKAKLIYDVLDEFPDFYLPHARKDSRSLMNITFNLKNKDLDGEFLKGTEERRMSSLKGHRSVGGFRASTYNAMPVEGCRALSDYLREFAKKHS